jgi:hypothetical protein
MAVAHYVLTLTGSAQALSTVSGATVDTVRTVSMQPGTANANPVYVGASGVSSTVFGVRLEVPVTNIPPAPFMLGETQSQIGHFKLSDVYVIGTNAEKLHLLVVTI